MLDERPNPKFTQRVYSTEVSEDAALDTRLIKLALAEDAENGDEQMSIDFEIQLVSSSSSPSSPFSIDSAGYVFVDGQLDRESVSRYNLSVTATRRRLDDSSVGRSDRAFVIVEVLDVNDEGPVIDEVARKVRDCVESRVCVF